MPREAFFCSLLANIPQKNLPIISACGIARTLRDYLVEDIKDTRPFIVALENTFALYCDNMKIYPLKSALSILEISLKIVFNSI